MALVGSGTSKIKNFYGAAALSAADVDESFAAFAEQLGGVKWLNGAASRAAGNLTYQNFVNGLALPNSYKREPNGRFYVTFRTADPYLPTGPYHIGAFVVPRAARIVSWFYRATNPTDYVAQFGSVSLYVDGLGVSSRQMTSDIGYTQGALVLNAPVRHGSVIAISGDATGITPPASWAVTAGVLLAAEHE
jgi:hypothetical protein